MAASLLLSLALLLAPILPSTAEQCFSKEYRDLVVNASAAFLAKGTALDGRASPSEQACLLNCCSQTGFKCNWAIYQPDRAGGKENCYLFYCDREDDCPLISMKGVKSYHIFTGAQHPTVDHITSTEEVKGASTAVTKQLDISSTPPTFRPTQSAPVVTTQTQTPPATVTTAQLTTAAVTTPTQVTTITQPATVTTITTQPTIGITTSTVTSQPDTPATTLPRSTTVIQQTTTTTATSTTMIQPVTTTNTSITEPITARSSSTEPITAIPSTAQPITAPTSTTQLTTTTAVANTQVTSASMTGTPVITTVLGTTAPTKTSKHLPSTLTQLTTITKSTSTYTPMQTTATISALAGKGQSSTTNEIVITVDLNEITNTHGTMTTEMSKTEVQTVTAMSFTKPNRPTKNHNKPTRKQAIKTASYNKRLLTTSPITILPINHTVKATTTKQNTTVSQAPKKPKTNLRTTTTTVKTTASAEKTTTKSTVENKRKATARGTTVIGATPQTALKELKSTLVVPLSTLNPVNTNPARKNPGRQGALKSSVEIVVVVALVFLTLVIALMGRKAMESFNRRQYTRLELNDLYYDV